MQARFDSFNRFEMPKFTLCKPGSVYNLGVITNSIGVLRNTSDEELVVNFNELSELNFVLHQTDAEHDPDDLYAKAKNHQYIFVDDIGYFCISQVEETIDPSGSYKSIKAESAEIELQNKTIPASFYSQESDVEYEYNATFGFDDLMELLVESLPYWTIGDVDSSLRTLHRTFEDVSEDTNILAFMLEDMQDAYECIFVFDTINRQINVYDQNNYLHSTSIHLTNDDIVNSVQISSDASEIYTALRVSGDSDVTISAVNPTGTSVIYRFDYYLDVMTNSLAAKVLAWESAIAGYESSYKTYAQSYYTQLANKIDKQADIDALEQNLTMYNRCKDNIIAACGLTSTSAKGFARGSAANTVTSNVKEYNKALSSGAAQLVVEKSHMDSLTVTSNSATTTYKATGTAGHEIEHLFVRNANGVYTRELTQASSVSAGKFTYAPSTKKLTFYNGDIANNSQIAVFYHSLDAGAKEDAVVVTDLFNIINSEITNVNSAIATAKSQLNTINTNLANIQRNMDNIRSAVDMNTYFTQSELEELTLYMFEGSYSDEYLTITDSMTYPEKLNQISDMYKRAKTQLEKVSKPTEQFSLDVENFIFQKKFEPWTEQLETGTLIAVELTPARPVSLLPQPYNDVSKKGYSFTSNGITWKTNSDGSVTATGTATDASTYTIASNASGSAVKPLCIDPSKHYVLSGCPSGGSNSKYYIEYTMYRINGGNSQTNKDTGAGIAINPNGTYNQIAFTINIASGFACPQGGLVFQPLFTYSHEDYMADLFLSNFTVNYADATLSMTFGNRYNKFDSKSLFEDLLGNIQRATNSLSFIKESIYPIRAGKLDAMQQVLDNVRTLSAGQALTAQNQDFIIDSTGITGLQLDEDGNPDDKQIKIVNNMLALTKDGWQTCDIAIGELLLGDDSVYGINAKVLMGDLILGSQLKISNNSGNLSFDNNGLNITNGTNTFTVNPNNSQKLLSLSNQSQDIMYVDNTGKLHLAESVILGGGTVGSNNSAYISTHNMSGTVAGTTSSSWRLTVGSNFGVTSAGSLYAKNANLSGTISANAGKIGGDDGWIITTNKIYNGTLGTNHSMFLGTSNLGTATIGGHNRSDWRFTVGPNFGVINNGSMCATNASISGTIVANAGKIGGDDGWTITTNKIYNGSIGANDSMFLGTANLGSATIADSARTDWRLTVGSGFGVTRNGALLSNAGRIGGWNISSQSLYKNNTVTKIGAIQSQALLYSPQNPTDNTAAFWIRRREYTGGDTSQDSSYGNWDNTFYVQYDGDVFCNSVITTSLYSPSSLYIRNRNSNGIEIDSEGVRLMVPNSSTPRVKIDMDSSYKQVLVTAPNGMFLNDKRVYNVGSLPVVGDTFSPTSSTNMQNNTITRCGSFTLPPGLWVVQVSMRYGNNSTGRREVWLSQDPNDPYPEINIRSRANQMAVSGDQTYVTFTTMIKVTGSEMAQFFICGYQNSGVTLAAMPRACWYGLYDR